MTLYELTKLIEKFATLEHVNSTFVGDIYDLNHLQNIEYPAFVITQGSHSQSFNDETMNINYSLFFVDRLLEDKSNELEVQSWAVEAVNNLVNNITEQKIGYVEGAGSVTTFTERFDSLCAGAYATINLKMFLNICDDAIKLVTSVNGMTGDVVIPTVDNIKTINGESLIGEGNIEIKGDVTSVNGKKGDVEITGKDIKIDSSFIDKDNVEDAIISIKGELEGTTDAVEYLGLEKIPEIENDIKNIKDDQETISGEIDDILSTDLPAKQDKLVSGTNIKTINGEDILGSGNIEIKGGSEEYGKVLDSNIPFKNQITDANTIYRIRYEFDLQNETVNIPENCTLKFEGGSLINGTINGNNTIIDGTETKLFDNIFISGIWNNTDVYLIWFNNDSDNDILQNGINLCNSGVNSNCYLEPKEYILDLSKYDNVTGTSGIKMVSNVNLNMLGASIKLLNPNNYTHYCCLNCKECNNIYIKDGNLIGESLEHTGEIGEFGYGIYLRGCENVVIDNVNISYFAGDGININIYRPEGEIGKVSKNILIKNCILDNNARQNISVIDVDKLRINNCQMLNTNSKAPAISPGAAIDFEPNKATDEYINDVIISNCILTGTREGIQAENKKEGVIDNIHFINCFIEKYSVISPGPTTNIIFDNCNFDERIVYRVGNIKFNECTFNGTIIIQKDKLDSICSNEFNNCYFNIKTYNKARSVLHISEIDKSIDISTLSNIKTYSFVCCKFNSTTDNAITNFIDGDRISVSELSYDIEPYFKLLDIRLIDCEFLPYKNANPTASKLAIGWKVECSTFVKGCKFYDLKSFWVFKPNNDSIFRFENNEIFSTANKNAILFNLQNNIQAGTHTQTFLPDADYIITNNIFNSYNELTPINKPTIIGSNKIKLVVKNNISNGFIFEDFSKNYFDINIFELKETIKNYPGNGCSNYRIIDDATKTSIIKGSNGQTVLDAKTKKLLISDGTNYYDTFGNLFPNDSKIVKSVNGKTGDVVLKTSDLTNDSEFVSETYIENNYTSQANFNALSQGYNTFVTNQTKKNNELDEKISEIQLFKFPNVTIIGEPTINNGQISDFTANDYIQFPFLVDFHNRAFEINMCFTTGNQVTTQENIFDSIDGLAFAVRNGKFVVAMSSDGQTWNMGEHIGKTNITPNTTYYVKFSWNRLVYTLNISTDKQTYTEDIKVTDTRSLFAKQIIIGKSTDNRYIFSGSINLNNCYLTIMGQHVWDGMDDAGLATRLATDLSNIDEAGVEKIEDIVYGEKYKVLVNNIPFKDQVNTPNTIYEIRYDFDLNGEEITIPENCTLKFEGGKLLNGKLVGNNTSIEANPVFIFDNIDLTTGLWSTDIFYAEWFGVKSSYIQGDTTLPTTGDIYNDCIIELTNAVNSIPVKSTLYLPQESYYITDTLIISRNINIKINNTLYSNCSQKPKPGIILYGISLIKFEAYRLRNKISSGSNTPIDLNTTTAPDYTKIPCGLELVNTTGVNVNINIIKSYPVALVTYAIDSGNNHNTIKINYISRCFQGIWHLTLGANGWNNNNTYEGTKFSWISWSNPNNYIPAFISMNSYLNTGESGTRYKNNSSLFKNIVCEYTGTSTTNIRILNIYNAGGNYFEFDRIEVSNLDENNINIASSALSNTVYIKFAWNDIKYNNYATGGNRVICNNMYAGNTNGYLSRHYFNEYTLNTNIELVGIESESATISNRVSSYTDSEIVKCYFCLKTNAEIKANTALISGLPSSNGYRIIFGKCSDSIYGTYTEYPFVLTRNTSYNFRSTVTTKNVIPANTYIILDFEYIILRNTYQTKTIQ